MSNKPKRWTWEEWLDHYFTNNEIMQKYHGVNFEDAAFHANEPLIDWQEKEIERLKENQGKCVSGNHFDKFIIIIETKDQEIKELKQRIEELEEYEFRYKELCKSWEECFGDEDE